MKMKPINYHQFEEKNHEIELLEKERKKPTVLSGPLYNMSKNKFLVLKKTLTEYLDKSFIRVNNSPAANSVFFVKNQGGNLSFCVDYPNFNRIKKKKSIFCSCFTNVFGTLVKPNGIPSSMSARFFTK